MPAAIPLAAAAVSAYGAIKSSQNNKDAAKTASQSSQQSTAKLDPRIESILFGDSTPRLKAGAQPTGTDEYGRPEYAPDAYEPTSQGLLSQYQQLGKAPEAAGLKNAGLLADQYLNSDSYGKDLGAMRQGSYDLLSKISAPQMEAATSNFYNPVVAAKSALPDQMQAAQIGSTPAYQATSSANSSIAAPSQNNLDLSNAYNKFINGESGNNPYLTGAIQKGINQSNNAFGNMIQDGSQAVQDALASIRGGAISSGQYGGSRQGLAEGRTLGDFSKNLMRAASQYGQNNTDAAVAAQAGQYNNDQGMKLNALNSLGAQQAQMALANAQMAQQNNQFNAAAANDAAKTNFLTGNQNATNNAQLQQQANQTNYNSALNNNQFNAGQQQQANLTNNASLLNNSQFNAGLQQQANQQNLGSQLQTNGLNSQNTLSGMSGLGNVMSNQYGLSNNQNNYDINRANQVNGLLTPYIGVNSTKSSTETNTQPMYTNTGANLMGGALMGWQLYNKFAGGSSNPVGGFTSANGYENYGGTPSFNYSTTPSISPFGN